jgi:hypothetical protein
MPVSKKFPFDMRRQGVTDLAFALTKATLQISPAARDLPKSQNRIVKIEVDGWVFTPSEIEITDAGEIVIRCNPLPTKEVKKDD